MKTFFKQIQSFLSAAVALLRKSSVGLNDLGKSITSSNIDYIYFNQYTHNNYRKSLENQKNLYNVKSLKNI